MPEVRRESQHPSLRAEYPTQAPIPFDMDQAIPVVLKKADASRVIPDPRGLVVLAVEFGRSSGKPRLVVLDYNMHTPLAVLAEHTRLTQEGVSMLLAEGLQFVWNSVLNKNWRFTGSHVELPNHNPYRIVQMGQEAIYFRRRTSVDNL